MHKSAGLLITASLLGAAALPGSPEKPLWPLTLREGLPAALPGYAAAPRDSLPDNDENEMGAYVEVSRFFQRIESPTSTKQFRLAIQDYGSGKNLLEAIRRAVAEAAHAPQVQTREVALSGFKAFVATDHSGAKPTTLVTVLVTPSRLVLAQGANVTGEEALKLLAFVDFARVATAK